MNSVQPADDHDPWKISRRGAVQTSVALATVHLAGCAVTQPSAMDAPLGRCSTRNRSST